MGCARLGLSGFKAGRCVLSILGLLGGPLFTRRLNQPKATELAGTEGAETPFFSPDGQWVAFSSGGKLKKISAEGGAAITLCDAPALRGGARGGDHPILAALTTTRP